MSDWRERIKRNPGNIDELSAEGMAVHRIMKSIGGSRKDIGSLCRRFGIRYDENESSFQRAVNIFRAVYSRADLVTLFDVKSGKDIKGMCEELSCDMRPCIVFYKDTVSGRMTSLVRGMNLAQSALGQLVMKPGIRLLFVKDDIQIWEQDPIALLRSFAC